MGRQFVRTVGVDGLVPWGRDIIVADGFEDLLLWTAGGTAGDRVVEKQQTRVFWGDYALHIKSRTTGATAGDTIAAYRYLYVPPTRALVLDLLFRPTTAAYVAGLMFELRWDVPTGYWRAYLKTNLVKWSYWGPANDWTDVPGGAQPLGASTWHRLRLSLSYLEGHYRTLVCDSKTLDLSSLPIYFSSGAGAERLRIRLEAEAKLNFAVEAWYDNVVLIAGGD